MSKYLFPKGSKNPAKRPEVREKIRLSKLGRKNPAKRPEVREKISKAKRGETWEKQSGLEETTRRKALMSKRMKGNQYGKGCVSWSKGLTRETDRRLAKVSEVLMGHAVSRETRRKISRGVKEAVKYYNTEEWRRKLSLSRIGRKHSAKTLRKMSVTRKKIWAGNPGLKGKLGRIKGYFRSDKMCKSIPYRSSYELRYMEMLEADPMVRGYWYEAVAIPYEGVDGKAHTTRPDFKILYVDGRLGLSEIKSVAFLEERATVVKLNAMREFCANEGLKFELITEKELGLG